MENKLNHCRYLLAPGSVLGLHRTVLEYSKMMLMETMKKELKGQLDFQSLRPQMLDMAYLHHWLWDMGLVVKSYPQILVMGFQLSLVG